MTNEEEKDFFVYEDVPLRRYKDVTVEKVGPSVDLEYIRMEDATITLTPPPKEKHMTKYKDYLESNEFRFLVLDAVTYYENRKFLNEDAFNSSFTYLINSIREKFQNGVEYNEDDTDFFQNNRQSDVEMAIALTLRNLLRNDMESHYRFMLEGIHNLVAESFSKLKETLPAAIELIKSGPAFPHATFPED